MVLIPVEAMCGPPGKNTACGAPRENVGSVDEPMTDKKEPSTPDSAKSGDTAKRPHATLDLKAVEVKGTTVAAPAGAASASGKAAPDPAATGKTTNAKPSEQKSAETNPSDAAAAAKPVQKAPVAAAPRSRIVSHLVSGLLGGALAFIGIEYGAEQAGPVLGVKLPSVAMQEAAADLQQRLTALEAAVKANALRSSETAGLPQKLEELDQTAAAVKALESAQARLVADAKAAAEDAVKQATDTNAGERLQKLEDRLGTLAAAAGTDADKGRIQGLAAVTGKVSDLETGFNTKLAEIRKGLIIELEARLAAASEASEKARTGTERLDRELASLKTDSARVAQNIEVQKSESERLAAAVQVVREDSAKLTSSLAGLKSAVDTQLSTMARPADVASAVSPVTEKLSALESSLAAVIKSEEERKIGAERIVVTLELANLKRALERGKGYAAELADVRKAAAGKVDLAVLDRYKDNGVKTLPELQRALSPIIIAAIDADTSATEGSVVDRLLAGAKAAVRVRKVSHDPNDKSAEAVMARMETALKDGQLGDVLALSKDLPERASGPVQDWLVNVEARHAVDTAIAAVEAGLKATLTGKSAAAAPSAAPAVQN